MAIPIIHDWQKYFSQPHEGLGSSYERIVLNGLLKRIVEEKRITTALESPSFGFTGVSGINLMALADIGIAVTLEDDDPERLALISSLWESLGRALRANLNRGYRILDYPDGSFDLSFSFSALWFVDNLRAYLAELTRVTGKAAFISVPNRDGIGYKMQVKDYNPDRYPEVRLGHIDPPSVRKIMAELGWRESEAGYFDCPPWPDIGMAKEDLLGKWFQRCPLCQRINRPKTEAKPERKPVTILDYYNGRDPGFADRMKRFAWLERLAPTAFKKYWAHHYYMVFLPVQR